MSVNRLPPPLRPALLKSRWTWSVSCWATTSSRNARIASSDDTSHRCVVTRTFGAVSSASARVSLSSSADRSQVATWHPASTSCSTNCRPIPLAPPVTTAIFPSKLCMPPILAQPSRRTPTHVCVRISADRSAEILTQTVNWAPRSGVGRMAGLVGARVRQSGDARHPRRVRGRATAPAVLPGRGGRDGARGGGSGERVLRRRGPLERRGGDAA